MVKQPRKSNTKYTPPRPADKKNRMNGEDNSGDVDMEADDELQVNKKLFVSSEQVPNPTRISTEPNMVLTNTLEHQLQVEPYLSLSKKPYKARFGEGDDYLHDSFNKCMIDVARLHKGEDIEMANVLREGVSLDVWIKIFSLVASNQYDSDILQRLEEQKIVNVDRVKTVISRLAKTNPAKLFSVTNSTIASEPASFAWYAAIKTVGSHYASKTKAQQKKITDFASNPADDALYTPVSKKTVKIAGVTPEPVVNPYKTSKSAPPKLVQQKVQVVPSKNEIRVIIKLHVHGVRDKTPNQDFIEKFKDLYSQAKKEDASAQLLPWKRLAPDDIIDTIADFPTNIDQIKKTYTHGLRIRNNSNTWFKVRFASNETTNLFLSGPNSNISWWFEDRKSASFACTAQNADDPVSLGYFIFSGAHIDYRRLTEAILIHGRAAYNKDLNFGIRIKTNNEVPKRPANAEPTNWVLTENKMLNIEVDRTDVDDLKRLLYLTFNAKNHLHRPGGYNMRILLNKEYTLAGSSGQKHRVATLRKHQAVISSLKLITTLEIRSLDETVKINDQKHTLRSILVRITYPLNLMDTTDDDSVSTLIHSVDFASSGNDATRGVVYITCYKDRYDTAQSFVQVLPAYIAEYYSRNALGVWFHSTALHIVDQINFDVDDKGNWNGTWTTKEDEYAQELLEEDMGFHIHFDGLEALREYSSGNTAVVTTEDVSFRSLGTDFGRPKMLTESANQSVASEAQSEDVREVAVAPGDGGPSV